MWALSETAELIAEAQAQRDGLRALAVLNMADPGVLASDNQDAADAVKDIPELELADAQLRQRKALANASSAGLHVEEYRPIDDKAVREVRDLVNAIYN